MNLCIYVLLYYVYDISLQCIRVRVSICMYKILYRKLQFTENCSVNFQSDVNKIAIFQISWLFLQIRDMMVDRKFQSENILELA